MRWLLVEAYDEVQSRRAFFLADIGLWRKAMPILQELEPRQNANPTFLFYLGYCYLQAKELDMAQIRLEKALSLNPPPAINFQAHCSLGMTFYDLGEFAKAKLELETGAKTATARYIKQEQIWKWLEYTCQQMGLKSEEEQYRRLARPS
jgi:tetratricopeptide (TPR) repeat protein